MEARNRMNHMEPHGTSNWLRVFCNSDFQNYFSRKWWFMWFMWFLVVL
jgi:hypothetical protein